MFRHHSLTYRFALKPGIFIPRTFTVCALPLLESRVPAGFPSPADDYLEQHLDLNEFLIEHPAATFFMRVEGDSIIGAGIQSGDLIIVDRAAPVGDNKVVVATVNGEFTIKRIKQRGTTLMLMPDNDQYPPLMVTDEMQVEVWGVVTYVIHRVSTP